MGNYRAIMIVAVLLALGLFSVGATQAQIAEEVFWNSVQRTDVIDEYRAYVQQFPKGKHAGAAWQRIGQLEAQIAAKKEAEESARREDEARRRSEAELARREEDRRQAEAAAAQNAQLEADKPIEKKHKKAKKKARPEVKDEI